MNYDRNVELIRMYDMAANIAERSATLLSMYWDEDVPQAIGHESHGCRSEVEVGLHWD